MRLELPGYVGLGALVGMALGSLGCVRHIDCSETETCPSHELSEGGADGAADGDAAEDGPLTCPAGTGDCDRAGFNGCEADLNNDSAHCGHCDQPCSGLCSGGICKMSEGGTDGAARD